MSPLLLYIRTVFKYVAVFDAYRAPLVATLCILASSIGIGIRKERKGVERGGRGRKEESSVIEIGPL
jgi:hypothetical protein